MAALATTLPCLIWQNHNHKQPSQSQADTGFQAWKAGLEVGMWNSIGYVAQAVGLETTLASKSAFLCSMAVVVVPLLDSLLLQKPSKPKEMLGLVMAILGVALLELTDSSSDALALTKGDWASMVQPLAFGIGFWRMEAAMHRFPQYAHTTTAAQLQAVFLGSLAYFGWVDATHMDWSNVGMWLHDPMIWCSLAWTGCVTTALTIYMETCALETLSAAETTLIFSTEPVSGSAFAAMVMGERFGSSAMMGSFLILMGCLVSNLGWNGIKKFWKEEERDDSATNLAAAESSP